MLSSRTSPVPPSTEIQSPSRTMRPPTSKIRRWSSTAISEAPKTPALVDGRGLVPVVEDRPDRLVHFLRPYAEQGGVLVDHVLVHQVPSHLDGGARRALARTRLQEVELALLHGELDVLHVLVVALETSGDFEDLVVDLRHPLMQGLDRQRRADARDDVLTLRVGQELGVEA